jgi:hypothetical protein
MLQQLPSQQLPSPATVSLSDLGRLDPLEMNLAVARNFTGEVVQGLFPVGRLFLT